MAPDIVRYSGLSFYVREHADFRVIRVGIFRQMVDVQRAEVLGKVTELRRRQVLIAKDEHAVTAERIIDF